MSTQPKKQPQLRLNRQAVVAAIESLARCRELRLSDTSTARAVVSAYLDSLREVGKR